MQTAMGLTALNAGFVMVPLTLAFIIAARRAGTAQKAGISSLIKGCAVQAAGLASLAVLAGMLDAPSMFYLMVPLTIFGYGQGLVMAQLFNIVLRPVAHSRAGSASGVLVTAQQVANATRRHGGAHGLFGARRDSPRVALVRWWAALRGPGCALCPGCSSRFVAAITGQGRPPRPPVRVHRRLSALPRNRCPPRQQGDGIGLSPSGCGTYCHSVRPARPVWGKAHHSKAHPHVRPWTFLAERPVGYQSSLHLVTWSGSAGQLSVPPGMVLDEALQHDGTLRPWRLRRRSISCATA